MSLVNISPIPAWRYPELRVTSTTIDGNPVSGVRLWDFEPTSVSLVLPQDACDVHVGSEILISLRSPAHSVDLQMAVERLGYTFGSFLIASGTTHGSTEEGNGRQRRANRRLALDENYPVTCVIDNGLDSSDAVICSVADVSLGGVGLSTSLRNKSLLPGLRLSCTIQTPFEGAFPGTLIVRAVRQEVRHGQPMLHVHCESEVDYSRDAESLRRHVVRFSLNELDDIISEKLIPSDLSNLIDYSVVPESQLSLVSIGRRYFSGDHELDVRAGQLPTTFAIVGKLGPHVVSVCVMARDETQAQSEHSMSNIRLHPSLPRDQLEHFLFDYIDGLSARPHTKESHDEPTAHDLLKHERSDRRNHRRKSRVAHVAWDRYAQAYDVMCSVNPAYQMNVQRLVEWLDTISLSDDALICDLGAGTGNFTCQLATRFPQSSVVHLDLDPVMNLTASKKYRRAGLSNISFELTSVGQAQLPLASFDLLVCVNALYAFSAQPDALKNMRKWLKPNGYLYVVDLGRPMNVADWSAYIIGSSLRTLGILGTLRAFVRGKEAITQNRYIRQSQDSGTYWVHTTDEFRRSLQLAGFEVQQMGTCYRDACDFAVCTPSMSASF